MLNVAIIDDGINESLYHIGYLKYNIEIHKDLKIRDRTNYNTYEYSHGTVCAAIIKKYAPSAILSSIKILDGKTSRGNKEQLIAAIKWCVNNKIKLINLSLGTTNNKDFYDIKNCINEIAKEGTIVIAACNNKNYYTYPASLSNVIGVRASKTYVEDQYRFEENIIDGIDIIASGVHYLKDFFGREYYTNIANSYAAPLITAKVHKIMIKNPRLTLEQTKRELFKSALNFKEFSYPYFKNSLDWIQNAIVININYTNFFVNKSICKFHVEYIINIELCLQNFHNTLNKYLTIINNASKCDTVIICMSEMARNYFSNNLNLFESFYILDKNIVFVYDLSDTIFSKKMYSLSNVCKHIWDAGYYTLTLKKKLNQEKKLDIPVIMICSNESNILFNTLGRFELLFNRDGYYPKVVCTECISILYGFNFLPYEVDSYNFINNIYKQYNNDIIILGVLDENIVNNFEKHDKLDIKVFIYNKYKKFNISNNCISNNIIYFEYESILEDEQILEIYEKILVLFNGDG